MAVTVQMKILVTNVLIKYKAITEFHDEIQ